MKRLSILSLMLMTSVAYVSSQNVVTGKVVDQDGAPVPGAKVEIVGGTESVITELDGTFRMETQEPAEKVQIMYVGMKTIRMDAGSDMEVKMVGKNKIKWNTKPEEYQWFVGAQMAVPDMDNFCPSYGLMIGRVKDFGWYVKATFNKKQDYDYEAYDKEYVDMFFRTTDKTKTTYSNVTCGVMARLWCPIYLTVGGGFSSCMTVQELENGKYMKRKFDVYDCFAADFGLMVRFNKLFVNGGVTLNFDTDNEKTHTVGNFGLGLYF